MSRTDDLLRLLDEGLSEAEVSAVLAAALLTLDGPGREALFARLPDDTAATLRCILARLAAPEVGPPIQSSHRVEQEWFAAWSAWEDVIEATGDEEGEWLEQDEPWHPPYFNGEGVVQALDEIAGYLLPLVGDVLARDLAPDFDLIGRLEEDFEAIGAGLPEWLDEISVEGLLGPKLTTLVLRWCWLGRDEGDTAFSVLSGLRQHEALTELWSLDGVALAAFVVELSDEEQRALTRSLAAHAGDPLWGGVLTWSGSPWFELYRALARRWDPAAELAICRAGIASDWTLALPVLEDLVSRGAHDEAAPVVERALTALLGGAGEPAWEPTERLLLDHRRLLGWRQDRHAFVARLLELGGRVAAGQGDGERAAAFDTQAFLLLEWERWDAVLEHLRALRGAGRPALADCFLHLWADRVVRHTADGGVGPAVRGPEPWVELLIAALWRDAEGEAPAVLSAWVQRAAESPAAFRAALPQVRRLTRDLGLDGAAPRLQRLLGEERTPLGVSRGVQVRRACGGAVIPALRAAWARHIAAVVPDPVEASGSRYGDHAAWLAAVRELDPAGYARILSDWRQRHHRRRNLWAALAVEGIR
ncbi:MAG: hypothetical protein ABIO70_28995 [Pseudomonadota bacterium]